MKEKARLTIKHIIKELGKLDKQVRSLENSSWVSQAEKEAKSGDEETLQRIYTYLNTIVSAQQAKDDTVIKLLVSENILASSITNKGWKFWKQSLLTEKEKKAVNSAVIRWLEAKTTRFNSLREEYEKLPNNNLHSQVNFLASVLDINSTSRQQLSADLKVILADSEDLVVKLSGIYLETGS